MTMSIRLVVFNKVVLVRHDHKAAAFSDGDDGVDRIDAFHGGCLKAATRPPRQSWPYRLSLARLVERGARCEAADGAVSLRKRTAEIASISNWRNDILSAA